MTVWRWVNSIFDMIYDYVQLQVISTQCSIKYVQFFYSFSVQHLVDWSRGMLSQIRVLNNNYTEWVNKPVDRPLRLFDSNLLESLTKTPWWLVPSIWIPIISLILNLGINDAFSRNYGYVIAGLLL